MVYVLEFAPEFFDDLDEIFDWYDLISEYQRNKFKMALENGLELIKENPYIFQDRYLSYKIHFLLKYPYGIHYYIENYIVIIVGIFHTKRDPQNWIKRIKK